MAIEDDLQDKLDDMVIEVLSLKTKLAAAHDLLARVANEAASEVIDDEVNDEEVIISDELYQSVHDYCVENDIEIKLDDDEDETDED